MSFGERCQLFQHFKFLCQVRIFSSNYIILIFWSIHVSQQYIDACVTGFLGVLAGTTLFGFGMSISLCYYNVYANLYDKAKLTALHYSLSGRVAIRLDELIGG